MKTLNKIGLTIAVFCFISNINAQGEQLFKAKCNACHLLGKNSTGPDLKGVKQKWTDAGEGELIYEWVKNPEGLIVSGKSKMATAIKDFSPSAMTPQQVSKEEVDAILTYVDTYEPPAESTSNGVANSTTSNTNTQIKYVPNYKENLNLFYWLLVGIFIQLLAIIIISNTIISLIKSDQFKKSLIQKNNSVINAIILILGFGFMSYQNTSYAFQFSYPGEYKELMPWLLVEDSDIYLLVIINLILTGIIIYLRRLFKSFVKMMIIEKQIAPKTSVVKKINRVLTDAVPLEQEQQIMFHHEYDGIRELDNNLPPWWVWGFIATIVFAIIYLFNYHVFHYSDSQIKAYEKDIKRSEREVKSYLSKMAINVDENTVTLLTDGSAISAGSAIFKANCVVCHNPNGEGNIGPNLTDKAWVYGFDVKDVFKIIKSGTPNGMPEHNSKLNPVQIQQVSSFVLQLKETKGKEPQGTLIEK